MLIEIDDVEELIAYTELSDIIEQQHDEDMEKEDFFTFKEEDILDHQGPLKSNDNNYKQSSYNVKVRWEDGSETWEPSIGFNCQGWPSIMHQVCHGTWFAPDT